MIQIIQIYLTKNMIGRELYTKEEIPHDIPEPKGNHVQQQRMLMQTYTMTKSLEELSLHAYAL